MACICVQIPLYVKESSEEDSAHVFVLSDVLNIEHSTTGFPSDLSLYDLSRLNYINARIRVIGDSIPLCLVQDKESGTVDALYGGSASGANTRRYRTVGEYLESVGCNGTQVERPRTVEGENYLMVFSVLCLYEWDHGTGNCRFSCDQRVVAGQIHVKGLFRDLEEMLWTLSRQREKTSNIQVNGVTLTVKWLNDKILTYRMNGHAGFSLCGRFRT